MRTAEAGHVGRMLYFRPVGDAVSESEQPVVIPDRALFKAAEVCELAKVQPYVLRSWEAEFKELGVAKAGSSTRVYRREDVERVLRIKHMLLIEGLTLAGVRRKLEDEAELPLLVVEAAPVVSNAAPALSDAARASITNVKREMRSLLDLLDAPVGRGGRAQKVLEFAPPEPVATQDDGAVGATARAASGAGRSKGSSRRAKASS